ncbi:hypothetical protein IQ215_03805 [Cyanobacterium stanieri LEGE 03274]|uniref:Lipoprotein n=1 Tax=Cyanobacterium stanieri LEGE 03274 TaxID=1828756 RepID=A0ABR9V1Q6_9CHRO|nr:hypothetical protein [Cyanobacterium stanieri]MBE9221813.1 hypothetical protein [Cyanobacterium stanieri LEGE 03274]
MTKAVVYPIVVATIFVSGCYPIENIKQNSLANQQQTSYAANNSPEDEIPTDIFSIIENEKRNNIKRPTNTAERRQMFYDELPPNFHQLPRSEQIKIRDRLIYSTMVEFREQSDINSVNEDIYEYDLPSSENSNTGSSSSHVNVFDYGIPYSGSGAE